MPRQRFGAGAGPAASESSSSDNDDDDNDGSDGAPHAALPIARLAASVLQQARGWWHHIPGFGVPLVAMAVSTLGQLVDGMQVGAPDQATWGLS